MHIITIILIVIGIAIGIVSLMFAVREAQTGFKNRKAKPDESFYLADGQRAHIGSKHQSLMVHAYSSTSFQIVSELEHLNSRQLTKKMHICEDTIAGQIWTIKGAPGVTIYIDKDNEAEVVLEPNSFDKIQAATFSFTYVMFGACLILILVGINTFIK